MAILLFVACHPDDEIISAGALLIKAKKLGYNIHLIWVTGGESSISSERGKRRAEAEKVAQELGAKYMFLNLPDSELNLFQTMKEVEASIKKIGPNVIVWPHGKEAEQHQDHRVLHDAILNIKQRYGYSGCCWLAAQPPVHSDRSFNPGYYLGFNEVLLREKHKLMKLYESEKEKDFASLDFFKTRARNWSYEGKVDSPFAEPYQPHKGIVPEELFHYEVVFYKDPDGSSPVEDYLKSLPPESWPKAYIWIHRLEFEGDSLPLSLAEKKEEGVWLGRAGRSCFYYYAWNANKNEYVLLHADRRKSSGNLKLSKERLRSYLEI